MLERIIRLFNPEYRTKKELRHQLEYLEHRCDVVLRDYVKRECVRLRTMHTETTVTLFELKNCKQEEFDRYVRTKIAEQLAVALAEDLRISSYYVPYEGRYVYYTDIQMVERERQEEKADEQSGTDRKSDS